MRLTSLICTAALIVAVAGCTHETGAGSPKGGSASADARSAGPSGAATSPPAGGATPTGATFTVATSLSVGQATAAVSGQQYQPLMTVPSTVRGQTVNKLALLDSGEAVVATAAAPDASGEQVRISQDTVGILGAKGSRAISATHRKGEAPRQSVYANARGATVAWMETTSTDLYTGDWWIFAHVGGRTLLVSTSAAVAPGGHVPATPGAATPVVGDGWVYWPTAYPTKVKNRFGLKVVGRRVDGSGPLRTVADRAGLPAADGPDVYYVRSATFAPGTPANRYEIHRVGADGRDQVAAAGRLGAGQQVSTLAADVGLVSWIVTSDDEQEKGQLFALDTASNQATRVQLADQGAGTVLSSSGRRVAWGNESGNGDAGMYLLDLRTAPMLSRLGEAEGLSYAMVAGGYVGWSRLSQDPEKPDDNVMIIARWN